MKTSLPGIENSASGTLRVALPVQRGLVFVARRDIIRCEARGNYTEIFLAGGRKLVISKTLCRLEAQLGGRPFLRIHHAHLINRDYLTAYIRGTGGYVVMTDGSEISVSRERKASFLGNLDYL